MSNNIIMIEGCDGCGKATVSNHLYHIINGLGQTASVIHFPDYESPTGKMISQMLSGDLFGDPVYADATQCSMLYLMDRLNYYAIHSYIFEEHDYLIMDRSWLSNIFFQGCKIYFRRLLAELKKLTPSSLVLIQIVDGPDDVKKYMNAVRNSTSGITIPPNYYFILRNAQYGLYKWDHSKRELHAICAYTHSNQRDEIEDVKKYIQTQYTMEIEGTPLKDCVIDSFYLGFGSAKDTAKHSEEQMQNRDYLDGHEKNTIYMELVDAFAEKVIKENWLPENVNLHYIQTRHASSEEEISNVSKAVACQILSIVSLANMKPELLPLPNHNGV